MRWIIAEWLRERDGSKWLKVDQSFARDMAEDADAAAISRAIVDLGHSLGYG